jgi:hypothetical protein
MSIANEYYKHRACILFDNNSLPAYVIFRDLIGQLVPWFLAELRKQQSLTILLKIFPANLNTNPSRRPLFGKKVSVTDSDLSNC